MDRPSPARPTAPPSARPPVRPTARPATRRVVLRAGAAFAAAALATSCSSSGGQGGDGSGGGDQAAGRDAPPPSSSPPASGSPSADPGRITVAVGGDVHFEGELAQRLAADPETALGPSIADTLSAADVAVVNLETAVTEGGTRAPGKEYAFRAPATAFTALASAGVDVASLANNHGMDFGAEGLADTLAEAEAAGFPLVGAGHNAAEAYAPHLVETGAGTVAVIGASDVLDEHLIAEWTATDTRPGLASAKYEQRARLVDAVAAAAKEADVVVVYLHWGLEGEHCPLPHAPELARALVEAGADAVVGGHAHVLSPGGYTGGAYVHYGLGNFAFYNYADATAETGVLTLEFEDGRAVGDTWTPARIEGGVPVPYEGAEAKDALAAWEGLRAECGGLDLAPAPEGGATEGTDDAVEAG
ncbi:CapA family protein [Streptomonospora sp. S1-112]|uniref:CapA family protein n=1 Tax=Streptomonospora mangrovi TaxID=2883123 RepID=A0A9X3SGD4_9ACTN|nr:CapA family protein [Streptomonospora mangrovi]MDA0565875.1 CapA family protein [Streptomonospora mangrovi]